MRIFTIGHSTRPIEEFISILRAHGMRILVDVRTVPRSRHNPQFESKALAGSLRQAGIQYRHLERLGGLRKAKKDSVNTAWKNVSFRGYADYMASDDFQAGIVELKDIAQADPTVIMCAEAVPWRCHRSLIADFLIASGIGVFHIYDEKAAKPHRTTRFMRIVDDKVVYPKNGQVGLL